jgi:hypothetical protein
MDAEGTFQEQIPQVHNESRTNTNGDCTNEGRFNPHDLPRHSNMT